jgi:hypothetical protein
MKNAAPIVPTPRLLGVEEMRREAPLILGKKAISLREKRLFYTDSHCRKLNWICHPSQPNFIATLHNNRKRTEVLSFIVIF